jgi:nicotinic acid mononucleotide adenylyltransferase
MSPITPSPSVASIIGADIEGADYGVFVGRVNPMHLGHQAIIGGLIETFGERHLVLIGSCNKPLSIRHLFPYHDRADFVRAAYPQARVAPLPDFENDDAAWFRALDDLLRLGGIDPAKAVYVGGSREDVEFYYEHGRRTQIVNRYGGATVNVSGSQIRDALIEKRPLDGLLDTRVGELVHARFPALWQAVRNR